MRSLSRRALFSSASALFICASLAPTSVAAVPLLAVVTGGRVALEIALDLFTAYVALQREMQSTQFSQSAISRIEGRLNSLAASVRRIESLSGELRRAFLQDSETAFLVQKIKDLGSRWGAYHDALGGAQTLDGIPSDVGEKEALKSLSNLKENIRILVAEIRDQAPYNPIIITPLFSAYSLIRAINERLLEGWGFFKDLFNSKDKAREHYDNELRRQFGEWLYTLKDPANPNSLAARKAELEVALPRAKTAIARFADFDRDFRREIVNWKGCPHGAGIASGISAERHASCLIARARNYGLWDWAEMKLVMVDTQVSLTSFRGCGDKFFPAEVFEVGVRRDTGALTGRQRYDSANWNDPARQLGRSGCEIRTFATIEDLERVESTGELLKDASDYPVSVTDFKQIVDASNKLQTELSVVLSAWEFVKTQPLPDKDGKFVIGVTYRRDPSVHLAFEVPERDQNTQ